jgi:hypothetical protein
MRLVDMLYAPVPLGLKNKSPCKQGLYHDRTGNHCVLSVRRIIRLDHPATDKNGHGKKTVACLDKPFENMLFQTKKQTR